MNKLVSTILRTGNKKNPELKLFPRLEKTITTTAQTAENETEIKLQTSKTLKRQLNDTPKRL
jgi:hypothetical protein